MKRLLCWLRGGHVARLSVKQAAWVVAFECRRCPAHWSIPLVD